MSYRSNLYIKAKHEAFPQIHTAILTLDDTPDYQEDDEYFYITLEGYKWYSDYADVESFNQLIYTLGEQNLVTMIREGEDSDDIETYGADPCELDLYYHTTLVLDGFDEDASPPTKIKQEYPEYFI